MSVTDAVSIAPPLESPALASASENVVAIPWTIWLAFAGIVVFKAGSMVDFAWHKSVGRDAFFTPGHNMMAIGGFLGGVAGFCEILLSTRGGASRRRDASVRVLGLHGPAGAFLLVWASIAMIAGSPFD